MSDDQSLLSAAEAIYNAILEAQRDAGDVALREALNMLTARTRQIGFKPTLRSGVRGRSPNVKGSRR
jgi:hypothetical protein